MGQKHFPTARTKDDDHQVTEGQRGQVEASQWQTDTGIREQDDSMAAAESGKQRASNEEED